jgi:hypothetical protein
MDFQSVDQIVLPGDVFQNISMLDGDPFLTSFENQSVNQQILQSNNFARSNISNNIQLCLSLAPNSKEQEIEDLINNNPHLKTLLDYAQEKLSQMNDRLYVLSVNGDSIRANGINLTFEQSLYALISPTSDNLTRTLLNEISEVIAQKINIFAVYRKSFQTYSLAIDQLVSLNENVTADSLNKIASSNEGAYRRFEEFPDEESTLAAIQTMKEVKPYIDFDSIGVELYPEQLTNGRYAIRAK